MVDDNSSNCLRNISKSFFHCAALVVLGQRKDTGRQQHHTTDPQVRAHVVFTPKHSAPPSACPGLLLIPSPRCLSEATCNWICQALL